MSGFNPPKDYDNGDFGSFLRNADVLSKGKLICTTLAQIFDILLYASEQFISGNSANGND